MNTPFTSLGLSTAVRKSRSCFLVALALLSAWAQAAITIDGITTRQYPGYNNSITFTVQPEAGFTTVAQVDGVNVLVGAPVTESRVGYHELFVTKTPTAGGTPETRLVQFIIASRVNADTGLPNWVPLEAVDASAEALATTEVAFYTPARVPAGMAFPLVVRLTRPGGTIAHLNTTVLASNAAGRAATWKIFRGAGAGVWNAPTTPGALELTLQIGDRAFTRTIQINPASAPQTLTGTVTGTQTFGPNANVNITGNVTVPVGATLRFEAGTIVRVAPNATIDVNGGAVVIAGTTDNPALFTRLDPALPWGGFWIRGVSASGNLTGAFLTGAGANPNWTGARGYNTHKPQQPVVACDTCPVNMTDLWIVDNPHGQAGHGHNAQVTYTRCVIQRVITGGQYNNGRARLLDSHIIECPKADYIFADDDNDGFYITGSTAPAAANPHELTNSVIGWCKDDGADAGSGSAGVVNTTNCWFDSMFHEGMAWSETRTANVTNTVSINNGQGIEAGFGNPAVTATNLLLIGNLTGARFGDNYNWMYGGTLNVQNSLLLHNFRDVWGFEWNSWTYRIERMTVENNLLTAPLALHPNNGIFNPTTQGAQVAAFLTAPATPRGFGVVRRPRQNPRTSYGGEVVIHLDRPATEPISLPWRLLGKRNVEDEADVQLSSGTVEFVAGMNAATLPMPPLPLSALNMEWLALLFDDTANAVATGAPGVHFIDLPAPPAAATLIAAGAVWKYLDNGSNQGTAWRGMGFGDTTWESGAAELGYGDGDETTIVDFIDADPATSGVQKNATTYFRRTFEVADVSQFASLDLSLRYDDGGVVYLNGQRIAATPNVPVDPAFNLYLGGGTAENSMLNATIPTSALVNGTNTLAVEIHQQSATSADLSFNLALVANPAAQAASLHFLSGRIGGRLHLFWTSPGIVPQESTDLLNWQDRPDLESPLVVVPEGPRGFYRLTLP